MTIDNAPLLEMYRRMLCIRHFEDAAQALSKRGEILGGLHLATGQEAEIVGACMALRPEDYMVGNHRSHGHPIGKGAKLGPLMAELLGRSDGVNGGKGGSMHLADFSVGSLGETSILGSGLPVAVGAALGAKRLGNGRISLAFFGDGASNEGAVHEAMNLAAVWKLPVIFLCENNGYAITMPTAGAVSVKDIATRAIAYDMPGHVVDGQDAVAVYDCVSAAAARARAGQGPTLVEAKTYRLGEHAVGLDHLKYRSDDEVAEWRKRDPIDVMRARLVAEQHGEDDLAALERSVREEVDAAVAFGLASPVPPREAAYEHVFVDPIIPERP